MNDNDKNFKLIFNNKYLFKLIFKYSRLYKKNEMILFKDRNSLINYNEREYIEIIEYSGNDTLEYGDLPYGVKIIIFKKESSISHLLFLPSTVHTIKSITIKLPTTNDNNSQEYRIPNSITSISFSGNSILSNSNGFIKLPNSIKDLQFGYNWNNQGIQNLKIGDIPNSVLNLSMSHYNLYNLEKGVIPNSVKKLSIVCKNEEQAEENDINDDELLFINGKYCLKSSLASKNKVITTNDYYFNFLPLNVESLFIESINLQITINSNLNNFKSIKKLDIHFNHQNKQNNQDNHDTLIEPNSLPISINELFICGFKGKLKKDIIPNQVSNLMLFYLPSTSTSSTSSSNNKISKYSIPNSVISLSLSYNQIIETNNILPSSLTYLDYRIESQFINYDKLINMISILPVSLTNLTLPLFTKNLNLKFPLNIKTINYN